MLFVKGRERVAKLQKENNMQHKGQLKSKKEKKTQIVALANKLN